jgi:hypothetical protein
MASLAALTQHTHCVQLSCHPGDRVVAISLNPLEWLGAGASVVVGDVWKAAMTALWSAGL